MSDQKNKTVGRSFRIKEQWLNILDEESKNERISSNALLNKILEEYCLALRHLKRFSVVVLGQTNFSNIIGDCPKENLIAYGKLSGSILANDIFHLMGLSFSKEDITFFLKEVLGHYATWFIYNHHEEGRKAVFHLRHNVGENWSIFVSEAVSTLLEHCSAHQVRREYTKNTVTLEVTFDKIPCTN